MEDPDTSVPQTIDKSFLRRAANYTEALCNLIYLIGEEAEDPAKVRYYASLSEQSLQSLTQLLHEAHDKNSIA